jgi:hypothetical protein
LSLLEKTVVSYKTVVSFKGTVVSFKETVLKVPPPPAPVPCQMRRQCGQSFCVDGCGFWFNYLLYLGPTRHWTGSCYIM